MKYIKKGKEPGVFTEWKKNPDNLQRNWKSFRRTVAKSHLLQALLEEQGYICCYCCASITKENCHIEHFKPQSKDENMRFEYTNLMVSCEAKYDNNPLIPIHCGHKKEEWYVDNLLVSPLYPNCESFFSYSGDGKILPTDNLSKKFAAEITIEKLGLNIEQLKARRSEAIDTILAITEELTDEEIQQMIEDYQKPDSDGKYIQFCTTIVYYLKNYC